MYLTKSDFKAAFDCRTKLYYRKNGYKTLSQDNEFLQMLADGGFMIEYAAKLRFPHAYDLTPHSKPEEAAKITRELLTRSDVTIFEASFVYGKFHVRTDILVKSGNVIKLIEVKSSSVEIPVDGGSPFRGEKGGVLADWKEYLFDLAYQMRVLRLVFPDFTVVPQLCLVNKRFIASEAETLGKFQIEKPPGQPKARPAITYSGDTGVLARSGLLAFCDASIEVSLLWDEMVSRSDALAALISESGVKRQPEAIANVYGICRKCDFRTDGPDSGFGECWADLAKAQPHVLDLYLVSQTGVKPDPISELLRKGQASFLLLAEAQLGTNKSAARRRMQWQSFSRDGKEILPDALRQELLTHQVLPGWPLHFVDFEACNIVLPHHAGMRPFERVAFQWSCHTIFEDGTVRHAEWLNDQLEFPNFKFLRSLRQCLGDVGTIYVWSAYEQATLRHIKEQIESRVQKDPEEVLRLAGLTQMAEVEDLLAWIEPVVGRNLLAGSRVRDLLEVCAGHYFHPRMGGRTSIKVVLPAVWGSDKRIRENPWFARYAVGDNEDPYKSLTALEFGDGEEDEVREGTGAVRVYQDLIFSVKSLPDERSKRRTLLLQYCELDTAAMVMVWAHWLGRYDLRLV